MASGKKMFSVHGALLIDEQLIIYRVKIRDLENNDKESWDSFVVVAYNLEGAAILAKDYWEREGEGKLVVGLEEIAYAVMYKEDR
jgi:hypothetical protein